MFRNHSLAFLQHSFLNSILQQSSTGIQPGGPYCSSVNPGGPACTSVHNCGPVCTKTNPSGFTCTNLHPCGPLCTSVNSPCNSIQLVGPTCTSVQTSGLPGLGANPDCPPGLGANPGGPKCTHPDCPSCTTGEFTFGGVPKHSNQSLQGRLLIVEYEYISNSQKKMYNVISIDIYLISI